MIKKINSVEEIASVPSNNSKRRTSKITQVRREKKLAKTTIEDIYIRKEPEDLFITRMNNKVFSGGSLTSGKGISYAAELNCGSGIFSHYDSIGNIYSEV